MSADREMASRTAEATQRELHPPETAGSSRMPDLLTPAATLSLLDLASPAGI
jgi:hypothetical protein